MSTKIILPLLPKDAGNQDRPVNALLKSQILHLQEAERRLPVRHRSDIYINAIKTEGEAAEYIRTVTEAIHNAHAEAAKRRAKRRPVIEIAAVAEEEPARRPKPGVKGKKKRKS
jgi:ArsR family metal-binding transcriptional regulator